MVKNTKQSRMALSSVKGVMEPLGYSCRLESGGKHLVIAASKGDRVHKLRFHRGTAVNEIHLTNHLAKQARQMVEKEADHVLQKEAKD